MDGAWAIAAGGWDARYAVALVVVSHGDIAAALIDTNGDGSEIDLDQYWRDADGDWVGDGSFGPAGRRGSSWSPHMVVAYGRGVPGGTVRLDYRGELHSVITSDSGWWLFIAPSQDEDTEVLVL